MSAPEDGLSDARKLEGRIRQVCRKHGIKLASTAFTLTEEGDVVQLKILLPPELFADKDEASVKMRDEFEDIMADFEDIDMFETVSMDEPTSPAKVDEEEDDDWW